MEYETSARSFKSFILLICYAGLILTLKFLIAAHNFVIIFLAPQTQNAAEGPGNKA